MVTIASQLNSLQIQQLNKNLELGSAGSGGGSMAFLRCLPHLILNMYGSLEVVRISNLPGIMPTLKKSGHGWLLDIESPPLTPSSFQNESALAFAYTTAKKSRAHFFSTPSPFRSPKGIQRRLL